MISALFHFLFPSGFTIMVFTINFWYVIGTVTDVKSSSIVKLLNGIFNSIASCFFSGFKQMEKTEKTSINYAFLAKIVLIPLFSVLIFVFLYKNANPIFKEYIEKIDFSFINFKWFLFTSLGYFLFYNLIKMNKIQPMTDADKNLDVKLKKSAKFKVESIRKENQIGITLIASLSGLILLVIATDILYLINNSSLENASNLSKQVHQGIYSIIASIVLAITVILVLFRKDLNFYKKNKNLKFLTFLWIILNAILVGITCFKNYTYVYSFGLTYKRIGVFVYLFLVLIGLYITFQKIYLKNNNWYLVRKNIQLVFFSLNLLVFINWNGLITKYNLYYAKTTDLNYLYSLPKTNSYLLKNYAKDHVMEDSKHEKINRRLKQYQTDLNNRTWQEFTLKNIQRNDLN